MSYFSCDIPYMSDEELKKTGIHIPEDVSDNNIGNIGYIRKQDMLDAVEKLDIIPSVDGMGIPTGAEDFRVQFLGTVLKVKPADVVSVSAYKQVMWERDTAVEQLKQIGKGLGEVMDDVVQVVRCKDCKFYTSMRPDIKTGICDLNVHHMGDDGFCSCGERRG